MRAVVRLLAAAGVIALVLMLIDVRAATGLLAAIPLRVTALGVALGLGRIALLSIRWSVLDGAIYAERQAPGVTKLSQWDYFRYMLANATAYLFLPSVLGADAARAALVVGEVTDDRLRRVLVIFFDRFLGIVSICLLGLGAAAVAPDLAYRGAYVAAIGGLNVGLMMLLALSFEGPHQRLLFATLERVGGLGDLMLRLIGEIASCLSTFSRHRGRVAAAFGLCLAVHFVSFILVDLAAGAVGIDLPFTTLAVMTTVSSVAVLIPISIGGLGVRELSFVALLAPQGVAAGEATALSLFQFVVIVGVGILGVPAVLYGRTAKTKAS